MLSFYSSKRSQVLSVVNNGDKNDVNSWIIVQIVPAEGLLCLMRNNTMLMYQFNSHLSLLRRSVFVSEIRNWLLKNCCREEKRKDLREAKKKTAKKGGRKDWTASWLHTTLIRWEYEDLLCVVQNRNGEMHPTSLVQLYLAQCPFSFCLYCLILLALIKDGLLCLDSSSPENFDCQNLHI